jgi:hypothetical protein
MWRAWLLALAGCAQLFGLDHPQRGAVGDGPLGGTATIGGTVSGLQGTGLVLQDDGGDDKPIAADGAFTFATPLVVGTPYAVTVSQQPANPLQSCVVSNGIGTASGDVTDVAVTCATPSFAIGGSVVGLANPGLSLHNAGTNEDLSVASGATSFTFATKMPSGAGYNVTIGAQPGGGQTCSLFGGQGTVGTGDITSIVVNCAANQYIVYGNVSGLQGTVVLKDTNTNPANSDTASLNANGSFAFTKTIVTGETYAVSVMTNPTYNAATGSLSQTCVPSNSSGTAPSVNPVAVSCMTNTFTIGGNVSGLMGSVVLQNNAANDLTVTSSGAFTFTTKIASGSTYAVTVKTQPPMQMCTVASGSGTVTSANITNVAVACAYVDPGIKCGNTFCNPASEGCCDPTGTAHCSAQAQCGSLWLPCDDDADCPAGKVCCAIENGTHTRVKDSNCTDPGLCSDANSQLVLCDPNNPMCPTGMCQPFDLLTGYYACQ